MRKVQITKHLKDVEVDEGGDAVFTCELNHADEDVQWFLNDKPLFNNKINTIQNVYKTHTVTLKNLAPQDGGTITFQVREEKETACLNIKGTLVKYNTNCNTVQMCFYCVTKLKYLYFAW